METNYERLKNEIDYIAEKTKLFPDALQERVFKLLISELLSNRSLQITNSTPHEIRNDDLYTDTVDNEPENDEQSPFGHPGEALFEFLREKNEAVQNISDVSFCTLIAYFYESLAPANERRSEINSKILIDAFETANRKPPGKPTNPLNNAKKRNYLKQGSDRGIFALTPNGRFFVKNVLLNENRNSE